MSSSPGQKPFVGQKCLADVEFEYLFAPQLVTTKIRERCLFGHPAIVAFSRDLDLFGADACRNNRS